MQKNGLRPITNTLPCIVCDKAITKLCPEHSTDNRANPEEMWNGGIVGEVVAGYGSKHDCDLFLVAICDMCIERAIYVKSLL